MSSIPQRLNLKKSQNLYNCLGFSRLKVLILQQTVLVTVLAINSAGKINGALSITNISPFAFCGFADVAH